jgi:HD-GYP domain-containing protein (c-di-GMP phosphodiesterase class II)
MKKTIPVDQLKVGMFVHLEKAWFKHPFLSNSFHIESESQIRKIVDHRIRMVVIDPEKTLSPKQRIQTGDNSQPSTGREGQDVKRTTPSPVIHPGKEVSPKDEFQIAADTQPPDGRKEQAVESTTPSAEQIRVHEAIDEIVRDRKAPPEEKVRAVQDMSIHMMHDLMDKPTAANIVQAKQTIARIVDLILQNHSITSHLVQITSHDFNTYTHSVTVGLLGVALSKVLFRDSDEHDLHELGAAFFLHDIGKVRVDTAIINKPGRLSEEEIDAMRKHPSFGYQVLRETDQLTVECREITLQHHERNDGTGYPKRLRGSDIHQYAKICAIADVYEALTAERPYKLPMKPYDALVMMKTKMSNHFQKDIFERFLLLFANGGT